MRLKVMFESLSDKLQNIVKKIKGEARIDEKTLKEMLREIKLALLEADVNYLVVKEFVSNIEQKALGANVLESLTPGQQVVKIVKDELVSLLGDSSSKINIAKNPPTIIMLVGLQGSGKTTLCGKLSNYLRKEGDASWLYGRTSYSFRGHDDPDVMVSTLVLSDPADNKDYGFMNMVYFTLDSMKIRSSDFDMTDCIRGELEWLVYYGIIEINRMERELIEAAFSALLSRFEERKTVSFFYWTKQDTLLNNAAIIDSGGTVLEADCFQNDAEVILPPEPLEISVKVVPNTTFKDMHAGGWDIEPRSGNLQILDIQGRACHRGRHDASGRAASRVIIGFDRNTGSVSRILSFLDQR